MARFVPTAAVVIGGFAMLVAIGCAGRPLLENPLAVEGDEAPPGVAPNPIFLALGPPEYNIVFEKSLDVLDDIFEISYANRYDGTIRTYPKLAPGLEQPWKPGSPEGVERLLCTFQSMRYRCELTIQPSERGGYTVQVIVLRELEDVPRPVRSTAGAAAFRSDNSVDRQYEVVDPSMIDSNWIPKGRETDLEQLILKRIRSKVSKCAGRS